MKKTYLKPEQSALEMEPGTLLVNSLESVHTNLEDEEIIFDKEPLEEDFWGR